MYHSISPRQYYYILYEYTIVKITILSVVRLRRAAAAADGWLGNLHGRGVWWEGKVRGHLCAVETTSRRPAVYFLR